MSTDSISPLRQRMIEDMNARKLGAGTQRSHIRSCKRFAAFLKRSPDTATAEDIRRFQLHLSETGMSICNRNRIMTGLRFLFRVTLRRLDLAAEIYHIREPQKIPLVMSPDETQAPAGRRHEPQGPRAAQSRLWLRIARRRGGPAQGQAYRQGAEHHSHRAVQGPQGSQCHAVARDARSVAAMVEGAPIALRCRQRPCRNAGCFLARRAGKPMTTRQLRPPVPRGGRCGRDQEGRDAACAAPQLRDPPARARHRYPFHPGAAGPRQIGHDGALHPRRHRHDRRHREPARPAVAAAQEAQEEQEGASRRRNGRRSCPVRCWRSRISSATTGRRGGEPMPDTSASAR